MAALAVVVVKPTLHLQQAELVEVRALLVALAAVGLTLVVEEEDGEPLAAIATAGLAPVELVEMLLL